MKVLLINGSPKAEGNTYLALKECAGEIEKYGVETEIFHIGDGPVRGCTGCGACKKSGACIYGGDVMPAMLKKMQEADGIIVGTPVYYAGPNGALCALLDRVFYSAAKTLKHKPASCIAVCRRGGATAALDRLNKYFTINEMPLVTSQYWNIIHGATPGQVLEDAEGLQIMRTLGRNMAFVVKELDGGEWPEKTEKSAWTNFIR